jgi:hypothetical protein
MISYISSNNCNIIEINGNTRNTRDFLSIDCKQSMESPALKQVKQ